MLCIFYGFDGCSDTGLAFLEALAGRKGGAERTIKEERLCSFHGLGKQAVLMAYKLIKYKSSIR